MGSNGNGGGKYMLINPCESLPPPSSIGGSSDALAATMHSGSIKNLMTFIAVDVVIIDAIDVIEVVGDGDAP